jgi:hypothetical protein
VDDARQRILARRARFVAAALASIPLSSGCEKKPEPCLSAVPTELRDAHSITAGSVSADAAPTDAEPHATAMPCLSYNPPPRDAGK